jgi:UDP-glucose 4-epimerase
MIVGAERAKDRVEILNIGSRDRVSVKTIADIVVSEIGLKNVEYRWTGGVKGGRGWIGDVREMLLSINKLESLGWKPKCGSNEAIKTAIREILAEKGLGSR